MSKPELWMQDLNIFDIANAESKQLMGHMC